MPHTKKIRYITPLEVQDILDNCYGCDCHLAMMQCISKGINDLIQGRPKGVIPKSIDRTTLSGKKVTVLPLKGFNQECKS